ncbi:MAG: cytochrome c [Saprospiraceae bacterium]
MNTITKLALLMLVAAALTACGEPGGEETGHEYMPDMAHSLAYDANLYQDYYYNTFDNESVVDKAKLAYPKYTVHGTVPRGYAGVELANGDLAGMVDEVDGRMSPGMRMMDELTRPSYTNGIAVPVNGHAPYYYLDTDEERLRAEAELTDNPFPITERGLAKGKLVYDLFCAICHGEKGNGLGYIYDTDQNPQAKYPLAPANFLNDEFSAAGNGRYYHAIMYGKNAMGAYADKMSYEERWQVIHYIRALQATDKKLVYDMNANTLNPAYGTPGGELGMVAQRMPQEETGPGADPAAAGEGAAIEENRTAPTGGESQSGAGTQPTTPAGEGTAPRKRK